MEEFKREAVQFTQIRGNPIARITCEMGISGSRIHPCRKGLAGKDSALSLKAPKTAVQRLFVQQPVQQRRRT
jgi:hypothetical protein